MSIIAMWPFRSRHKKTAELQIKIRTLLTSFFWCNDHHEKDVQKREGGDCWKEEEEKKGRGDCNFFYARRFHSKRKRGATSGSCHGKSPRATHSHTHPSFEEKKISFSFFQPAHIHTHTHTPSTIKEWKNKETCRPPWLC